MKPPQADKPLDGLLPEPFLLSYSVFVFSFPYFSFLCRALD